LEVGCEDGGRSKVLGSFSLIIRENTGNFSFIWLTGRDIARRNLLNWRHFLHCEEKHPLK